MKTLLIASLLLAGCATVTSESYQKITVKTEPKGAYCALANRAGTYEVKETPSVAHVTRNFSPLSIHCEKDGLKDSVILEPQTRLRTYGNILMLGLPALVDAGTGEGYEYDEDQVNLTLK